MIFNTTLNEADIESAEEKVMTGVIDPDTAEGVEEIADEVEKAIQQEAFMSMSFFEGGQEALDEFYVSPDYEVMTEARKYAKKTFVRIGKEDDLKRRISLAAIIIGRETKDPLYTRMILNRAKYKKDKNALIKKNYNKAVKIAKKSQMQHIKDMKKMPALPKFVR